MDKKIRNYYQPSHRYGGEEYEFYLDDNLYFEDDRNFEEDDLILFDDFDE